ncbi:recombinase family protein (plasmid) [Labrenzia sp. 5N]|uniref:recombinase family protein n=1 Tax=Labrenzia sp. 5N TaxID=2723402 RepID=UPI00144771D9|nr:recombinase family protein [Labrenzia sp. 5N]NKX68276.1 recombinase family protein [Labrenzia sp. 5N]
MFIRAYLRASTKEQNAARAQDELQAFAVARGWTIAAKYIENESGATLKRPELFRLLADSHPGDVLLVEQIDRLSRLTAKDWERLKSEIATKQVRIVALDLPTSWAMLTAEQDDLHRRIFEAINSMMLDMLAAIARKDYDSRRHRQTQGIEAAKKAGAYKGRRENTERNAAIVRMLQDGQSWATIQHATGCSSSTLQRLSKRMKAAKAP